MSYFNSQGIGNSQDPYLDAVVKEFCRLHRLNCLPFASTRVEAPVALKTTPLIAQTSNIKASIS